MPSVDDPDDALSAVLAGLAASARQANLARAEVIAAALAALADGTLQEEQRLAAEQAAHQVVGSAGTFGARHASELAAGLEERLAALQPDPGAAVASAGADDLDQLLDQLAELRRELQGPHQVEE